MENNMEKREIKFRDILTKVTLESENKKDYITQMSNIHMDRNGGISFIDTSKVDGPKIRDVRFNTTDWGQTQAFGKLGMPSQYFKKLKSSKPDLVADHFNYWAKNSDKDILVRTKIKNQDNGLIRGILSDKYTILDNDTALDSLGKILEGNDSAFSIRSLHLDDKRIHVRITFPDLTKKVGVDVQGNPDNLQVGMDFVNSEVGASSLNIMAMVYRLVCKNGLRAWCVDDRFSQRHIHFKSYELHMRMAEAMAKSLNSGIELTDHLEKTITKQIENPFSVIDKLAKENGFTQDFTDDTKENFDGVKSAYGIINAITASAKELPNERRLDTERFAGKLITLSDGEWARLDTLEKETV